MAPTTFEQLSNLEHFFLPFPWALFFFFVLLFIGFFFLFFFFFRCFSSGLIVIKLSQIMRKYRLQ